MPYKPEEKVFCNDGREQQLLEFIRNHPGHESMKGSPEAVLIAIDEFGTTKDFLMNVGQEKGAIVAKVIAEQKPKILVEIGGYVGFSGIMFGDALRKAGGEKYISLELNSSFASVARELIALAGLERTVDIVEGPCRESLRRLKEQTGGKQVDVLFIDHSKPLYLNELKLCEELGLVQPGTTVIADDMIQSPNAQYSAYVRDSPVVKKEQLAKGKASNVEGDVSLGNPSLIYETILVHGHEPTGNDDGVEISYCRGESN